MWDTAAVYGEGTSVTLTVEEVETLEKLGDETGVNTLREWEKEMI